MSEGIAWVSTRDRLPEITVDNDPTGCFYSRAVLFCPRSPVARMEDEFEDPWERQATRAGRLYANEWDAARGRLAYVFRDEMESDDYRPEDVVCWAYFPEPPKP